MGGLETGFYGKVLPQSDGQPGSHPTAGPAAAEVPVLYYIHLCVFNIQRDATI